MEKDLYDLLTDDLVNRVTDRINMDVNSDEFANTTNTISVGVEELIKAKKLMNDQDINQKKAEMEQKNHEEEMKFRLKQHEEEMKLREQDLKQKAKQHEEEMKQRIKENEIREQDLNMRNEQRKIELENHRAEMDIRARELEARMDEHKEEMKLRQLEMEQKHAEVMREMEIKADSEKKKMIGTIVAASVAAAGTIVCVVLKINHENFWIPEIIHFEQDDSFTYTAGKEIVRKVFKQ